MKKENLNIEDFFRQSLEGYRINPPESIWNRINLRLDIRQFFRPDFSRFNIYYSSIIVLVATTVGIFISTQNNDELILSNQVQSKNVIIQQEQGKPNNESINNASEKIIQKTESNNRQITTGKVYSSIQVKTYPMADSQSVSLLKLVRNFEPILKLGQDSLNQIKTIVPVLPKPLFTVLSKEGCAPFELKIKNYTQGANEYFWTFGDGGNSKGESPEYTYMYPGVYKIQLKVVGLGGSAVSLIDSIIVYDKPIIKSFWPYQSDLMVGEKVVIPIQTSNAAKFEWDFGDGGIVRKKQVEYSYKNPGDYSINLKFWTEKNCFDSIKIADIKVVNNETKIVFPNAFCPNPDGPSSGKYAGRESHFDIFHPFVKGRLIEYKLSIYSRVGGIVFESDDINIGWDGYFENRLMPEGVYPFIATGKFESGESFLKKGNITIIYRK